MFGFANRATRQGRRLADLLDADRLRLKAEIWPGASSAATAGPDKVLRGFQMYCILALTIERSYSAQAQSILEVAFDCLLSQGDRDITERAAKAAWTAFETNQDECREFLATELLSKTPLPSDQIRELVRRELSVFHQCVQVSIAAILGDAELLRQTVAESAIPVPPEVAAILRGE